MTTTAKRLFTYLKLTKNHPEVLGQFGDCVVATLVNNKDQLVQDVSVHCDLAEKGLILSKAETGQSSSVILRHPPFCPMFNLTDKERSLLPKETLDRGISVAVAVILEATDFKILMTRRPKHMRTFPNVWVPPGGGSEENETLLQTGLRELCEETGLDVKKAMSFAEPLCVWESVYPPVLIKGQPRRHTMVLYMHVGVSKSSIDLQKLVKLDPEETNACSWLNFDQMKITCGLDDSETIKDETMTIYEVDHDIVGKEVTAEILSNQMPFELSNDVERLSTGTRFAIEQFVLKKKKSLQKNSQL